MSYYRDFPIEFAGIGWYKLIKCYGLFKLVRCTWCESALFILPQEVIYG